jgi:hypothetical protein
MNRQQPTQRFVRGRVGFKGVSVRRQTKYAAHIRTCTKLINLGTFDNPIEAALEYDKAAIRYHGDRAITNKQLGLIQ